MNSPSSASIPAWQIERAGVLHQACLSLQSAIGNGEKVRHALRRIARRHHGRKFNCDPSRQIKLSPITLRRAWNAWRRGGERLSAFPMQYPGNTSSITSPVIERFAEFCARGHQPTLKSAWRRYAKSGGFSGRGRRAGQPLNISYSTLVRYFSGAEFYLIQSHLRNIQAEQTALSKGLFTIKAGIRSRLPEHLPPRRHKRAINFEI